MAETHLESVPVGTRTVPIAPTRMNATPAAGISSVETLSIESCRSIKTHSGLPFVSGKLIVYSDDGNKIPLWDTDTDQQVVLGEAVNPSIAVGADGKFAFIDSQENRLMVYSASIKKDVAPNTARSTADEFIIRHSSSRT